MLRTLTRGRGLSTAVILTLALSVGALTMTFGVVRAALWRPPPFPDADRIALLFLERNEPGEAPRRERWSFARFSLLAESQDIFDHVASYSPSSVTLTTGDGDAELTASERVSASYFSLLGTGVSRGRLFTDAEDDPLRPSPVVVLSHELWASRFVSDTSILGRTIRLNGIPLTVIGVMRPGFGGLSGNARLWFPRTMSPQINYAEYLTTNQNFISAVGKLKSDVDRATASTTLALLGATINRALPSDPQNPDERVTAHAVPLNEARVDRTVRRSLYIVLAAVSLLHVLACVNVINLLLGRQASRQHESAVRVALGSSTWRLFTHLTGEGLVLGLAGGILGTLLAFWGSTVIAPPANVWAPRNFYGSLAPFDTPTFTMPELSFGLSLAFVTALLVALLPALRAFGIDVSSGIRTGSRGIVDNAITLRRPSARGVIVSIEAALAMMLMVTAGLLVDSFQRMRATGIGVETANVLTFWVIPSEARVPPAIAPAFVSRLLESISAVPGVQSVSVDGGAPMTGSASAGLLIGGRPTPAPGQVPIVTRHYIGVDHFTTLGIPLRRGRPFSSRDQAGSPRVAIISESAARRFWPDQDPLGQRIWFSGGSSFNSPDSSAEIVGIVGDVVYAPLDQQPNKSSFYTPYAQFTYPARMVFVKATGNPDAMVPALRKAVAAVDPELAIRDVQALDDVVTASWARHRFDALIFSGFGIAALLLAASGIFAVLSYAVQTRTREFGVRIALGANPGRVVRHVLREGMAFPLVGLIAGASLSLAVTTLLQSSLYGVSPREPRVFLGTAVLLALVAVVACVIPAWRATRIDPCEALRSE